MTLLCLAHFRLLSPDGPEPQKLRIASCEYWQSPGVCIEIPEHPAIILRLLADS